VSLLKSNPVSLLKKSRRSALIAGSVCALGLGGVAFAVPASASTSASASASDLTCSVWSDSQTAGFACYGDNAWISTNAQCQDGSYQIGNAVQTNTGDVSYAYCAGHGGLAAFWVNVDV
jgi:hypothetical protein